MRAEADVGRLEAETVGDFGGGRRGAAALRQARQGEIGGQRLAAPMARDADDVADLFLQDHAQILRREQLRRAQMREQRRRADRRMAGEGQLARRGEDAQRRGVDGSRGARTNTVSARLNSRAIFCMRASSSPSASSTTASGLPASGASVKTSSVW